MRQIIPILGLWVFTLAITGCKKNNSVINTCFENEPTTRLIVNKHAVVKQLNDQFYIIEEFTIDTRLKPCKLATEFKVNDLPVKISGNVKATGAVNGEPCCTENFVITKIEK